MNYLRYKGFCANIYYDSFLKSYYVIIKYHGESVMIKANTVENLEYEFYEKVDELMSDEEDKGVNLKTCPFCNNLRGPGLHRHPVQPERPARRPVHLRLRLRSG